MKENVLALYFRMVPWFLYLFGALPEKKQMRTKLRTYLFNTVWPIAFILFWIPLYSMVTFKVFQFIVKKEWDDLFDTMHMQLLASNTLYIVYAVQKTAKYYKSVMDKIEEHFVSWDGFGLINSVMMILLLLVLYSSFFFFWGVNIYYGELPVPCWIPFIDNDRPLSTPLFLAFFAYEGLAGIGTVMIYGFLSPFIIVSTMVIIKEIRFLIRKLEHFKFEDEKLKQRDKTVPSSKGHFVKEKNKYINEEKDLSLGTLCCSESYTKALIYDFVKHHKKIRSVMHDVSKIYRYIFVTQAVFTITHSCFLAFNMYYTTRLTKVLLKSTPILCLSYYLLYIFCWNGQRLTDTCEELFRALYRCEWYNCPRSFKTSLLIVMAFCCRPVKLTGGGFINASFETFLLGLQQSISYVLFLYQVTRTKTN